jgi:hypothetical protein
MAILRANNKRDLPVLAVLLLYPKPKQNPEELKRPKEQLEGVNTFVATTVAIAFAAS